MSRNAIWMTDVQLAELVDLAQANTKLWADLLDREIEGEAILKLPPLPIGRDRSAKQPSMSMLIEQLICERHGAGHPYLAGQVGFAIRRLLRIELGLPI